MANVLGINLSELSPRAVETKIKEFLHDQKQHYLVTPNPEIILSSHHDEELFYILNKADLSLADGFGLKVAGFLSGLKIPRITGADITLDLLALANSQDIKVAVMNWRGGLSSKNDIEQALRIKYPALRSLTLDVSRSQPLDTDTIKAINDFSPVILFNTFGSPYQEKVIYHNLSKFTSVKLALGIGGAFDFITRKAIRAPKLFRVMGLEWLWRLIKQPKRWKRIFNATFVFTAKLLRAKIDKLFYRQNVACLLYKDNGGQKKILIVEREDTPGYWQLPQGGTDGEKLEVAGARELREELNTSKFVTRGSFKNTYSYIFPPINEQAGRSTRWAKCGYKGQRQGLYIAEFTGSDQNIKINYWDHRSWKWVDSSRFVSEVHPIRQESAKIFLDKFKSLNL